MTDLPAMFPSYGSCRKGEYRIRGALTDQLLALLVNEDWLPDLDLRITTGGFAVRNILVDEARTPKIMDFTAYFDVYRLHPARTRYEVNERGQTLRRFAEKLGQ